MSTKTEPTAAPSAVRIDFDWSRFDWHEFASRTCTKVDWTTIAKQALGSATLAMLVGGAVTVIGRAIEADMQAKRIAAAQRAADEARVIDAEDEVITDAAPESGSDPASSADSDFEPMPAPAVAPEVAAAAALLGVAVDANADEIRAALRHALSASRLHPDHGGDGEQAKALIAAK